MGKVVSKFQIQMTCGRPVIKMLDRASQVTDGVFELEGDSIYENVEKILSYVYEKHESFSEGFAPIKSGDRWGYINLALRVVLAPRYQVALPVKEGFALVKEVNKYYFWNMTGTNCLRWNSEGYESASPFCNGLACVKRDGLYGYISSSRSNVEEIPCKFEMAYSFDPEQPCAVVKTGGKYGVIDKSGNMIVEPIFDSYTTYMRTIGKTLYNATIDDKYYRLCVDGSYHEVKMPSC